MSMPPAGETTGLSRHGLDDLDHRKLKNPLDTSGIADVFKPTTDKSEPNAQKLPQRDPGVNINLDMPPRIRGNPSSALSEQQNAAQAPPTPGIPDDKWDFGHSSNPKPSLCQLLRALPKSRKANPPWTSRLKERMPPEGGPGSRSLPSNDSSFREFIKELASSLLDSHLLRQSFERTLKKSTLRQMPGFLRPLVANLGRDLKAESRSVIQHLTVLTLVEHAAEVVDALLLMSLPETSIDYLYSKESREDHVEEHLQSLKARSGVRLKDEERQPPNLTAKDMPAGALAPRDSTPSAKPALTEVRHFMKNNESFDLLLATVIEALYDDARETVQDLLNIPCPAYEERSIEVSFRVCHEMETYLDQEVPQPARGELLSVGHLLTVTGQANLAYAHNARAYMELHWPATYCHVIEVIDRLLGLTRHSTKGMIMCPIRADEVANAGARLTQMTLRVLYEKTGPGTANIQILASSWIVYEIALQLLWLVAAIRAPMKGTTTTSRALIDTLSEETYSIRPVRLQVLEKDQDICWLPLFLGACLVRGFPVPSRGEEVGVEIPLDLMISLAGPLYPVKKEGGIYLQGFSRALYPTVMSNDGGSVQWHLMSSKSRLQKLEHGHLAAENWLQVPDPSRLAAARTFLGVYREAAIHLGTDTSGDCYREITFSGAFEETNGRPAVGAPSSMTAGTSGLGIFGVTTTVPIVYGRSLARATNDNESDFDYIDILEICKERPVILYDTADDSQRRWMVPLLCVILHLIHTWTVQEADSRLCFPFVEPAWNSAHAAAKRLYRSADVDLRSRPANADRNDDEIFWPGKAEPKSIKILVKQLWRGITQRVEDDLKASAEQPQIESDFSKLRGWDYMDFIVKKPYRRMQVDFHGNWGPFTRDVLVLFGKCFGEVIRPSQDTCVCPMWKSIPPKRQYLVAMVDCLRWLAWTRGGTYKSISTARVTDKYLWEHDEMKSFDCSNLVNPLAPRQTQLCVEHLQKLVKLSSTGLSPIAYPPPQEAAVAFGQRRLQRPEEIPGQRREATVPGPVLVGNPWNIVVRLRAPIHRMRITRRAGAMGATDTSDDITYDV